MKTIYGLFLMLGDLLLMIPISVWIIVFVIYILYTAMTRKATGNLYILFNMVFYFVLLNYMDITYNFVNCLGLGFLIPIVMMVAIPFVAMILTVVILKILFGVIN